MTALREVQTSSSEPDRLTVVASRSEDEIDGLGTTSSLPSSQSLILLQPPTESKAAGDLSSPRAFTSKFPPLLASPSPPSTANSLTAAPPIVLLRRPASPPRAPQGEGSLTQSAASEKTPATDDDLATQTGCLTLEPREGEDGGSRGASADGNAGSAALDAVLLQALNHPRDRFLLLRAEVEIERFVATPSATRLPLSPPHFQPNLNSYQRLLIHRLADVFGITREVEAAPAMWNGGPAINPSTGQPQGVVVLVKGDRTRLPIAKLASFAPAPDLSSTPATASASSAASPAPSMPSSPAIAGSATFPSSSPSPTSAPAQPQQVFRILPRSADSRGGSSTSSSVGTEDDISIAASGSASTSAQSKRRRDLTLEQREAAYKEARERIFNQPEPERLPPAASTSATSSGASEAEVGITRPSSAGSSFSRSSAAYSLSGARPSPSIASESSMRSVYSGYYQPPPPHFSHAPSYPASLRPSAPIFDPASGGWAYPQQQQEYAYSEGYGSESSYGQRPSPSVQSYAPSYPPPQNIPSSAYAPPPSQPPIHVTASSPYSQAATFAYGTPQANNYSLSTQPPPHAYSQQSPYDAVPWQQSTLPHSLPSPSLSTSSGASMHRPPHPAHTASSGSGSGYLMRFADGAVVAPGGAVTVPTTGGSRSIGSLSSTSIASLSSLTSARTNPSRFSGAGAGSSALSGRRLSASTTHSVGSISAISSAQDESPGTSRKSLSGASSSAAVSENGSVAGGSSEERRRGRQMTLLGRQSTGSVAGSEGGKGKQNAREKEEAEADDAKLHPSLPTKPGWTADQPPMERAAASTQSGGGEKPEDLSHPSLPHPVAPTSYPQPSQLQYPAPPQPVQPPQQHSHPAFPAYPAPMSTSIAAPPNFPPAPPPLFPSHPGAPAWGAPPASEAYAHHHPADFAPMSGLPPPTAPYYPSHPQHAHPPPQPSVRPTWSIPTHAAPGPQPRAYHPSVPLQQQQFQAFGPPSSAQEDLMTMPDIRRPPPRTRQLFDPSKPGGGGGGGGGGKGRE